MSNSNTFIIKASTIGFGKAEKNVKGLSSSMKKFAAGLISVSAAYKGLGVAFDSIKLAGRLEGVEQAFNNLRKEAGFSINTFNKLDKAVNGTVDRVTLMTQANNAMLLGIAESDDQMAELFDTAQRLARAVGQDAAFGIESFVTGLGRQSREMLDNLGLMVSAEDAQKKYADALGKSVSKLTDQEKKQAFVNEAMSQADILVSSMGIETETTADKLNKLNTSVTNFKIAVGDALIESGAIDMFNSFTAALSEYADKMREADENTVEYTEDQNQLAQLIAMDKMAIAELNEQLDAFNLLRDGQVDRNASIIEQRKQENEILKATFLVNELMNETGQNEVELRERLESLIQSYTATMNSNTEELINSRAESRGMNEETEKTIELTKESNKQEKTKLQLMLDQIKAGAKKITFEKDAAKLSKGIGKAAIKFGKMNAMEEWQTTLSMALVNAAAAIIKAGKTGGFKGGLLMAAQMAPQVSAIYANKPEMQGQTGFEGVIDEPTQFTVGEGGAAEYVSVTPLEGVNNAGGQGVNINISGNVMSDQFVEEELAERIQEAVRKGVDFGMS